MHEIILKLHSIGVIKFGSKEIVKDFFSPLHIDLSPLLFHTKIAKELIDCIWQKLSHLHFDILCGSLPYGNLFACNLAVEHGFPLLLPKAKTTPLGSKFAGSYKTASTCLVMHDIQLFGQETLDLIDELEEEGLRVHETYSVIDFEIGGKKKIKSRQLISHSCFKITEILEILMEKEKIGGEQYKLSMDFLASEK